jgi:hypothetical protein
MKTTKIFLVGTLLMFTTMIIANTSQNNKNYKHTKEIVFSEFNKISTNCVANLRIHFSDEYRVVISSNKNVLEKLKIFTVEDRLEIFADSKNKSFFNLFEYNTGKKVNVDLYVPNIKEISINSDSKVVFDEGSINNLELSLYGKGKIDWSKLICENLIVNTYGIGNIYFSNAQFNKLEVIAQNVGNCIFESGKTDSLFVVQKGVGDIDASKLITRSALVLLNGNARIKVNATESIVTDKTGMGRIINVGTAEMDKEYPKEKINWSSPNLFGR